jgi:hypothetical protein
MKNLISINTSNYDYPIAIIDNVFINNTVVSGVIHIIDGHRD